MFLRLTHFTRRWLPLGLLLLASSAHARSEMTFTGWLALPAAERPDPATFDFGIRPLTKGESEEASKQLWEDHATRIRAERKVEMKRKTIELDGRTMRFETRTYGSKPSSGRALFLSLHGGGGTPPHVNESQWKNQVRLGDAYRPKDSLYLAPRAPTDTWNLWHQAHVDTFFDRLIETLVATGEVDPDRVFVMGYSAGGDGVFQLGPRMADRLAGACMMAGHPNETKPFGLRNLPFSIDMGANDSAYRRNQVAAEWKEKLEALRAGDPDGYRHRVSIHRGKGHWVDLEDRASVGWIRQFERNPYPDRVVWFQDDVTHERLYWLALPPGSATKGQHLVVNRKKQTITIEKTGGVGRLLLRFNDTMVDLDESIRVHDSAGRLLFEGKLERNLATLAKTLSERGDPRLIFSAELELEILP